MNNIVEKFMITGKVCVITGATGLIGKRHTEAVLEGEGIPVLLDLSQDRLDEMKAQFLTQYKNVAIETYVCDITNVDNIIRVKDSLMQKYGHIDALINNAANNPKMEGGSKNMTAFQFHNLPIEIWNADLQVGLTGAFLCAQIFGHIMEQQKQGVVLNISSDYGIISPDQRIYRKDGLADEEQLVKPISYSVVKHGIIGMTKYLATYWGQKGVRVNTLCPASLHNGQDDDFVKKISELIPMHRMSNPEEYTCTILYLISQASSYMTGATVILDGGRTSW